MPEWCSVGLTKSTNMRRPHILISGAWLLHSIAWFLPVVQGEVTFPHGLPGWQAFRVAACAVWPYEGIKVDEWYYAVLSTISAVTTPLFIFGSVWVVSRGSRTLRRASAWVATSAFVLNAHWYVLFGSDRDDLRIGYFLWWFSFLFLALGLFDLSTRRTDEMKVKSGFVGLPDKFLLVLSYSENC
jgi:hypothetical protein